jgi:hypothetical protein
MTLENRASPTFDSMSKLRTSSYQLHRSPSLAAMKARQSAKIRAIAKALIGAGFLTLDEQAKALRLPRSTVWTVLKGCHKSSGLSAKVVSRVLAVRQLSPRVRAEVLEYIEEKIAGHYGHSEKLRRKFMIALSAKPAATQVRIAKIAATGSETLAVQQHRAQKVPLASKSD